MRLVLPDDQYFTDAGAPNQGAEVTIQEQYWDYAIDAYTDLLQKHKATSPIVADASGRVGNLYRDGLYKVVHSDGWEKDSSGIDYDNAAYGYYYNDLDQLYGVGVEFAEEVSSPSRTRLYFTESASSTNNQVLHWRVFSSTEPFICTYDPISAAAVDLYIYDAAGTLVLPNALYFERYVW